VLDDAGGTVGWTCLLELERHLLLVCEGLGVLVLLELDHDAAVWKLSWCCNGLDSDDVGWRGMNGWP